MSNWNTEKMTRFDENEHVGVNDDISIFCPLCQEVLNCPSVKNLEEHLIHVHKVDKQISKQWIETSKRIANEVHQNRCDSNANNQQSSSSIIFSPQSSTETNISLLAAKSSSYSDTSQEYEVEDLKAVNLPKISIVQPKYQRNTSSQRSPRTKFTEFQKQLLKNYFIYCQRPSPNQIEQLSNELSLDGRVIGVWFQNSRQKHRSTQSITKRCRGNHAKNTSQINQRHISATSISTLANDDDDPSTKEETHYDSMGEYQKNSQRSKSILSEQFGVNKDLGAIITELKLKFGSNISTVSAENIRNVSNSIDADLEEYNEQKLRIIENFSDDGEDEESPTVSKSTVEEKDSHNNFDGLKAKRACKELGGKEIEIDDGAEENFESELRAKIRIVPREPRQIRTRVTLEQQFAMDKAFYAQKYPKHEIISDLSQKTKLPVQVVRNWFQNRRAKEKRLQQEQNKQKHGEYNRDNHNFVLNQVNNSATDMKIDGCDDY